MLVNADLHIHGRFSIGVSKNMTLENLAREARRKGIQLLGTGDCLHPKWLEELDNLNRIDEGTYEFEDTRFVLTTEVEDSSRVHHLLIFPSKNSIFEFRERIEKSSKNLNTDGRPNVRMNGEEIAQNAKDLDVMIGPSHAFTPWTSLYASHNSLEESYGDLADYVSFAELGLSADSAYGDRIAELAGLTFLTNSDAHSLHATKLAREFNRFELRDVIFDDLRKAILRKGSNRILLNVGLPPQEGKYNETACSRCYVHYHLLDAKTRKWRCACGGRIKKGVKDRVEELATSKEPKHPEHRPNYLHLIPLAEIIMKALGMSSPLAKKVTKEWERLISIFKNEVAVLVDVPIEDIVKVAGENIANAVQMFRDGRILIKPGGGGQYGTIIIPGLESVEEEEYLRQLSQDTISGQKSLKDY